jgi:hypothetical protein
MAIGGIMQVLEPSKIRCSDAYAVSVNLGYYKDFQNKLILLICVIDVSRNLFPP